MAERDLTLPLRGALAALSGGAAGLHFAIAPDHFAMHWTMGAGFLVAGLAQLLWAVLLLERPTRGVIAWGAVGQGLLVATYLVVHTAGWPFGAQAWQPEAHTVAGVLCCLLELGCAFGVMATAPWAAPTFRVPSPGLVIPVVGVLVVGLTSGTVAFGGATEHHTHGIAHAHVATAATHGHGHVDTTPPTEAQRRAADALLAASRASMARYADVAVARKAGYRVIHNAGDVLLHYGQPAYMRDTRTLDPDRMESLIYVHLGRNDLLVGGMYMVPKGQHGPAIGGSLTPWHAHDDLCLDPVKAIAISQTPDGCPAGSAIGTTGEMMHVWAIDYPGGPFAELDPVSLRTAVKQYYGMGDPE
ncbi:MAG: hypothetical protein QOE05_2789 [Actinomycetota bacterium]|nr:hypothetical protein [Actinomycetota bacterium]